MLTSLKPDHRQEPSVLWRKTNIDLLFQLTFVLWSRNLKHLFRVPISTRSLRQLVALGQVVFSLFLIAVYCLRTRLCPRRPCPAAWIVNTSFGVSAVLGA